MEKLYRRMHPTATSTKNIAVNAQAHGCDYAQEILDSRKLPCCWISLWIISPLKQQGNTIASLLLNNLI